MAVGTQRILGLDRSRVSRNLKYVAVRLSAAQLVSGSPRFDSPELTFTGVKSSQRVNEGFTIQLAVQCSLELICGQTRALLVEATA